MQTRWAKDLSTTLPLPEHPRPLMQRESWGNLNGPWQYAILPAQQETPDRWEGTILVPFPVESRLSGVQRFVGKENRLWYRRTFEKPPLAADQRLLLHFGAVDWHAAVWVNGACVGEHRGGYDPFTFDITDALTQGKEQTLVVGVWDPTDEGTQPRGKQRVNPSGIWYTPVTGIWQTVWWEVVPAAHIARLKVTPDVDQNRFWVLVTVAGGGEGLHAAAILRDGGEAIVRTEAAVAAGEGGWAALLVLDVPRPRLWSPDSPFLYDLEVLLRRTDKDLDRVKSYCALRKVSVCKDAGGIDRLALNDEILFHLGPLDQGWWPDGLYTAPTDEALRFDIEVTKRLGFNATRKHVKVEPARWYYWADRLGLMVWQDMPNAGPVSTPIGGPEGEAAPEVSAQFRAELKAVIDALSSHPSIVIWVPFNEGWGQHDTNAILGWVKEYDPTRLVDGPSGWMDMGFGDLIDLHRYPGPSMHPPVHGRASVLGEFGGVGCAVEGHLWTAEKNWGYLSARSLEELQNVYDRLIDELEQYLPAGLAAAIYTQLTDVENEVNGLLTYDREVVKLDAARLARRHRGLYAPVTSRRHHTLLATGEAAPQSWRYTLDQPGGAWAHLEFDDSSWQEGTAPFGSLEAPLFRVSTAWTTGSIWLRRRFSLTETQIAAMRPAASLLDGVSPGEERQWHGRDVPPSVLFLRLHNYGNAVIYLNGVEVRRERGGSPYYRLLPLGEAGTQALRRGENLLAVYCERAEPPRLIDAGLVDLR